MKRAFWILAVGAVVSAVMAATIGRAADKPVLSVTRLDCGGFQINDLNAFSDTNAYTGLTKRLTDSCYLIRHGDAYMLWDTGLPAALKGQPQDSKAVFVPSLDKTIVEQLAVLGVKPEQISLIGISHIHGDHTGQAQAFPQAKLLIGKGDWDLLGTGSPLAADSVKALAHWLGGGAYEAVMGDKDIFGDGTVMMLNMPGHTPGHHSLMVSLEQTGKLLLTGDLAHFHENYASNGVPGFNTDRADSLASLDRFKALAKTMKATVIIQHDPRDIAKLPAFPAAAR
ncbi:MAG: N-acyl homoserine lactonase family protein [Sphingobium sp.]|nr:N-acyl homoserine lactonase family protein [Sphingobium sp.]MBP8670714.1 N-acyl homoserine lactonase family protein [Sphingobium sp.]MBP9156535.1 N-acyl homoserine lactonase family protein [Sphingobium sp.]